MNAHSSVFKTVIVHEDSITAIQAAEMLTRMAERLESGFGIDRNILQVGSNIWTFERLEDPELWAQVVDRTVEADMIIVSADGSTELPACVRNWLESVLPRKRGGPTALVALFDFQRKPRSASAHSGDYLRQVAEQYGVDFFCNLDGRPPAVDLGMNRSFASSANFLEETIPSDPNRRGWGIND